MITRKETIYHLLPFHLQFGFIEGALIKYKIISTLLIQQGSTSFCFKESVLGKLDRVISCTACYEMELKHYLLASSYD